MQGFFREKTCLAFLQMDIFTFQKCSHLRLWVGCDLIPSTIRSCAVLGASLQKKYCHGFDWPNAHLQVASTIEPSCSCEKPVTTIIADYYLAVRQPHTMKGAGREYRHPFVVSKTRKKCRADQPQWAIDITDRAGKRLRQRYRRLINNGKMPCKATIGIARELADFI